MIVRAVWDIATGPVAGYYVFLGHPTEDHWMMWRGPDTPVIEPTVLIPYGSMAGFRVRVQAFDADGHLSVLSEPSLPFYGPARGVPEPSGTVMVVVGLIALAVLRRWRR